MTVPGQSWPPLGVKRGRKAEVYPLLWTVVMLAAENEVERFTMAMKTSWMFDSRVAKSSATT